MWRWFFVALLLAPPIFAVAPPIPELWVAVVAPDYRDAIAPLVAHRKAQGFRVVVLDGQQKNLLAEVRRTCKQHPGRCYVLLVGAVDSRFPNQCVPAQLGTISRMKNQPSDALYGCLDGSRLPSVAVGRFPAQSVREVEQMVARTIRAETSPMSEPRSQQLTILAGIPAFNAVADRLMESVAFARFDQMNPRWTGRAIYTNPQSRFCPPDTLLHEKAKQLIGEGQGFLLYLGHSDATGLYGGPRTAFLDRNDFRTLKFPDAGCVFLTFGCLGSQLQGADGEGYAVAAMRNPHGPTATLGSHGICFAAMVQLAVDGLFAEAFKEKQAKVVGDCYLACLRGIERGKIDFLTYRMLDAVDGDPKIPQLTQRQEHLEMFVLLGDPALRLPQRQSTLKLNVPTRVKAGEKLRIEGRAGDAKIAGKVRITLERSPASEPLNLEKLPTEPKARQQAQLRNFAKANDFVLARAEGEIKEGAFVVEIEIPAGLPYRTLVVRAQSRDGSGVKRIELMGTK
jgi:hypothetical protein